MPNDGRLVGPGDANADEMIARNVGKAERKEGRNEGKSAEVAVQRRRLKYFGEEQEDQRINGENQVVVQ